MVERKHFIKSCMCLLKRSPTAFVFFVFFGFATLQQIAIAIVNVITHLPVSFSLSCSSFITCLVISIHSASISCLHFKV